MAITESGGRMSIRVTGYDFVVVVVVSKWCYICDPISHIILLWDPQCYIFCRSEWLTTTITPVPLAGTPLASSTLAVYWRLTTVEGLCKQ
jgi:hypothetical protein